MIVAASDSSARSATTAVIAGWSTRSDPNALRCRTCHAASATDWRMPAAVPMTQSSRVCVTICTIVATPRPSSPTSHAVVPASSISLEAFERLPSLSFSRWMRNTFREPSGSTRGTKKQLRPPGACASTRNASLIGALQNHLCPVSANSRPHPSSPPVGSARVVFARTSEPPCFSVIAMPTSAEAFGGRVAPRAAGRVSRPSSRRGSYSRLSSRGIQSSRSPDAASSSVGTAACVIDTGHACPGSTCAKRKNAAARSTFAPGPGEAHADVCAPAATAALMMRWYASSYSTSSMRLPQWSCACSTGECVFAFSASCWNAAEPTRRTDVRGRGGGLRGDRGSPRRRARSAPSLPPRRAARSRRTHRCPREVAPGSGPRAC